MADLIHSLKLLADPIRLRLLLLLREEELSVAELQEIFAMGQSRISTHLAQLKRAGLVRDRRVGKNVYYAPGAIERGPTRAILSASEGEIDEVEHDRAALRLIRRKRQDKTRDYFNRLAGRFGRSYCPGRSWKGFAWMLLPLAGPIVVADLGAGEGTLSQFLARYVKEVIAIDNSEKMVEYGSGLARENGLTNLCYRLGDMEEPPLKPESIDFAVFSQALHHAGNPARALAAAHSALRPGGRIAILDLLSHPFEQARELYADLWLGFSEVQLEEMLTAAGFTGIDIAVMDREQEPPNFQSVLATAFKAPALVGKGPVG